MQLDPTIRAFYEERGEEDRLGRGLPLLEAHRTRSLIERYATLAPATVLDVGGAAGAYASWLTELGYIVHLVDRVPRLVAEAKHRNRLLPHQIATYSVADARALPFPDQCADIVLLLGPLYHLISGPDRALALEEARRVLKPDGLLFAAAISRWAYALYGLAKDHLFEDPAFEKVVRSSVRDGHHRGEIGDRYFTTAYFHRPDELQSELIGSGFVIEGCYGLEGPCGMFSDFDERWNDPRRRAEMIRITEMIESEPSLLGVSPHLLAVARKPPG